jgi:hypothetical protein
MRQRGQNLVEYVLLLSALALLSAEALSIFGPRLQGAWSATAHFFSLPSP